MFDTYRPNVLRSDIGYNNNNNNNNKAAATTTITIP